jgi:outer membrane murein-binding lipoprotein Lpp
MTAPAGEPQQAEEQPERTEAPPEKTFTQSQLTAIVERKRREIESQFEGFDDLKAKAAQLDALTESTKSEVQRATESAAQFKARMEAEASEKAKVQLENVRYKISAKKGLDPDLWDRVTGSTEDEITADVEKLVTKFGPTGRQPNGPLRSGASAGSPENPKDAAVRAIRAMRANQ